MANWSDLYNVEEDESLDVKSTWDSFINEESEEDKVEDITVSNTWDSFVDKDEPIEATTNTVTTRNTEEAPTTIPMPEQLTKGQQELSFEEMVAREGQVDPAIAKLPKLADTGIEPEGGFIAPEDQPVKPITPREALDATGTYFKESGLPGYVAEVGKASAFLGKKFGQLTGIEGIEDIYAKEQAFWEQKEKDYASDKYNVSVTDNPSILLDPGYVNYHLGKMVGGVLLGGAATKTLQLGAAGAALSSGVAVSAAPAVDTYEEVLKETGNEAVAARTAGTQMLTSSMLESFGFTKMIKPVGGVLLRGAKGFITEGSTEFTDEFLQNINKDVAILAEKGNSMPEIADKIKPKVAGYIKSSLDAGITGGMIGKVAAVATGSKKIEEGTLPNQDESTAIVDQVTGTPRDRIATDTEAIAFLKEYEQYSPKVNTKKSAEVSARVFQDLPKGRGEQVADLFDAADTRDLQKESPSAAILPTLEEEGIFNKIEPSSEEKAAILATEEAILNKGITTESGDKVLPETKVETIDNKQEATVVEAQEMTKVAPQNVETVSMTTDEFIELSTKDDKTVDRIKEEGFVEKGTEEYQEYEEGDPQAMKFSRKIANESKVNPYIIVNKDGKVVGHNGRHRAIFTSEDAMEVTVIYEGDITPVGELKPQFPRKEYIHEATGTVVTASRDGSSFELPNGEKYPTVAEANRSIMKSIEAVVTDDQELVKPKGYEKTGELVPTSRSPEDILISREGEGLTEVLPNVPIVPKSSTVAREGEPKLSTVSRGEGRRRIVSRKVSTPTLTELDTSISQADGTIPQSDTYNNLVTSIINSDQQAITEALNSYPANSRKAILRSATGDAETRATTLGDADIDKVIETSEEATRAISGRKLKAGSVEMKGDGRSTGVYEGIDEATGNKYKAFKVGGKYKVISNGDVIIKDGPRSIEAVLPMIKLHAEQSSGLTIKRLKKGDKDWTVAREQVKVYNADGNIVNSFPTVKEANAYKEATVAGKEYTPGKTVVKKKTPISKEAKAEAKEISKKDKQKEAEKKKALDEADDTKPSAVKSIKVTDEMRKKYEKTTLHDLTSSQSYEIMATEEDIATMDEEIQDGSLATLRDKLEAFGVSPDILIAVEVAEKAIRKSPRKIVMSLDTTPSASAGYIVSKGDLDVITISPIYRSGNYRGVNYLTVLHEVYHHITTDLLTTDPEFEGRIKSLREQLIETANLSEADQAILKAYDYEGGSFKMGMDIKDGKIKVDNFNVMYGLSSNQEFIGTLINSRDMRKLASDTKATGDLNYLEKFANLIVKYLKKFGIVKGKDLNIIEAMLGTVNSAWDKDVRLPKVTKGIDLASFDFNESLDKLMNAEDTKTDKDGFIKSTSDFVRTAYRKGLRGIDNVLGDIDPYLKSRFQDYVATTEQKTMKRSNDVSGWARGFKDLSPSDFQKYRFGLLNYHKTDARNLIDSIHSDNPELAKEFKKVEKVLKDITVDMTDTGMIPKGRKNYFPTKVDDLQGLMNHMGKLGEGTLMAEVVADLPKGASELEVKEAMGSMLSRGVYPAMLNRPGSAKTKTIWDKDEKMVEFYSDPVETLLAHITKATKTVEQYKLVGKSKQGSLEESITKLKAKKKLTNKEQARLAIAEKELAAIAIEMEGNIGSWVSERALANNIDPDDQRIVRDVLHAHFNEQAMPKWLSNMKTLGTIGAIGSFTSTVAQIPDLAGTMNQFGYRNTIGSLMNRNKLYTKDDIVTGSILEQHGEASNLQKVLKTTLWSTGFTKFDTFFKDVAMDAAINKAKKMSLDNFKEKFGDTYNEKGELEQLYKDIQSDTKSDNSMRFAFNSLAEVQPISTSNMPEFYAKSPIGRMVYTLKSFAVKILNNVQNAYKDGMKEGFAGIEKGHKAAVTKSLAYIATLVALGAPAGCLQQLMLGRECDLSEEVLDSLLVLVFQSRYSMDRISKGGISEYFKNLFFPPMGYLDKPFKDVSNYIRDDRDATWSTVTEVPVVGKITHNWLSQEEIKKKERKKRENIFSHYKSMLKNGATSGDRKKLREMVQEYNKGIKKTGSSKIDRKSLDRAKSKYKDKLSKTKDGGPVKALVGAVEAAADFLGPKSAMATELPKTEVSYNYTDLLKDQENSKLIDSNKRIYPNKPPEDSDTTDIGYGHKLTKAQEKAQKVYGIDISNGITEKQATTILEEDISRHKTKAMEHYGKNKWDDLSGPEKDLLTDLSFTGVLRKFPSLIRAIKDKDKDRIIKEYKRYFTKDGKKVPMNRRNKMAKELVDKIIESWVEEEN